MPIINSSSQTVGVASLDINRPTTQQNKEKEKKNRERLGLVKDKCESPENLSLKVKGFLLTYMHVYKHSDVRHPSTHPHINTYLEIY